MTKVHYDTTQIVEIDAPSGTFEAFGVFVSKPAWADNIVEEDTDELVQKHISLAGEGNIVGLEVDGVKDDRFYRVMEISRERSEYKKIRLTTQDGEQVILTKITGSQYLVERQNSDGTTQTKDRSTVEVLAVPDKYLMDELGEAHQILAQRI